MISTIFSSARIQGKVTLLQIEVHATGIGLPGTVIVGTGGGLGRETILRIRAALRELGWKLPAKKYTVNIFPNLETKIPSHLEAAIAVGLLVAAECLPPPPFPISFFGSITLSGKLKSTPDLSALLSLFTKHNSVHLFVPELRTLTIWPDNLKVHAIASLKQLREKSWENISTIHSSTLLPNFISVPLLLHTPQTFQFLEIITLGRHSTLWYGPPGEGKTSLTKFSQILSPPLSDMEVFKRLQSLPTHLQTHLYTPVTQEPNPQLSARQLLQLQNTSDRIILNDLPLYPKQTREQLLHLMEHANGVHVLATMNPCFCCAQPGQKCTCTASIKRWYQEKITSALLDRFDCAQFLTRDFGQGDIPNVRAHEKQFIESRNRILKGNFRQKERHKTGAPAFNSMYTSKDISTHARLTSKAWIFLQRATVSLKCSTRRTYSIARVARSIADLMDSESTTEDHVAMAIQHRPPNRLSEES